MSLTPLTTGPDDHATHAYLIEALKHLSQAEISRRIGKDPRTVRRWMADQSVPKQYAHDLQRLLPFGDPPPDDGRFRFIDLFAGIGGIRTAFEGIGGRCVFTSEWDSYAQRTYAENFGADSHVLHGDITQIDAADIPDHDVLLAGFPCQPFSIAGVSKKNALGRSHGFADETQGTLFFDICRIIDRKKPRAFLLENVKNLMSHDKGRTWDVIKRALIDLGYDISPRVVDGARFVPQHRERILIVGFRRELQVAFDWDALPMPPKGGHTLKEILHRTDGSEPFIESDGERFFDHAARKPQDKYTLTPKLWAYLQGYAEKHRAKGNGFGFGLVFPDSVARTLSARYYKDGSEILVYQGEQRSPRRLTPRECARLMGFPDTFRIPVSDTRAYLLLSNAALVPMASAAAKLMAPYLNVTPSVETPRSVQIPEDAMNSGRWTKPQVKLAFHLYCQLPFGKLDSRNPEVIELAKLIGRTAGAVAMKLVNLASLDPAITGTGRKGLSNASALDREVWDEFHSDWEGLALECADLRAALGSESAETVTGGDADDALGLGDFIGETRVVMVRQRIKQHFFRRAVVSSYRGRCCMSRLADSRLLVASHIVPWSKDKENRLNPSNGLCLSAIHDKAFDQGLISLSDDFQVLISRNLLKQDDAFVQQIFLPLAGRRIEMPERFVPSVEFLRYHREIVFLDNRSDVG
ncbi:MAG: DNA (cytosine-5-)-methyltransferase [Gammaproteobacteria bacterium]|nr:DNA (cytosine-5-)-methyltransferase [Gammaproteobacteria bacterium]MBU0773153.1 DNA (cytosine-5-)-methyltransferase [Gammaproteobacteria bacterium]MBU0855402.1 DNA (cytosine-5-)-methyltransferase [Gammaproteobacteria bacterium]MBU1848888.1 DNA (cytosine-5-)-methyltransferase [Gammaproteobacteria bacterium]